MQAFVLWDEKKLALGHFNWHAIQWQSAVLSQGEKKKEASNRHWLHRKWARGMEKSHFLVVYGS